MNKAGNNLIQAIEWEKGKYGVTTGTFADVHVISCLSDGSITGAFKEGDETISMVAGSDVTVGNIDVTIVSGTWAFN